MTLNYKKYLLTAGATSLLLLSAIALFNYIVDPYNLLNNNKTGVYFWNERQVKANILKYNHEAVLMGSSKTGYVNPDDLDCYKFYNASLRGGLPEEIYFYLKAHLKNEKLVIIAFDFYMFNEREYPLKMLSDWQDIQYSIPEYLLGAHTTEASHKTIKKWLKNEKTHSMQPNGQFIYPGKDEGHQTSEKSPETQQQYVNIIEGLVNNHYSEFSFSQSRLASVKNIKKLLKNRDITYAVLINPLNEDVLAALKGSQAHKFFIQWRKEMRTIFPDLYDFSSSHYSAVKGFYSKDPYHYTPQTGKTFLNEVIEDFCPAEYSNRKL